MKNIFDPTILFKKEHTSVVSELYAISLKSLPVAMILSLLSTIFLYEQLGKLIVI